MDIRKMVPVGLRFLLLGIGLSVVALALSGVGDVLSAALVTDSSGLKAEYVVTRLAKGIGTAGSAVQLEEGTFFISPDGRHRIESIRGEKRERSIEIVLPAARQRIKLDPVHKRATIGSTAAVFLGPASGGQPSPIGPPSDLDVDAVWTDLGTKDIGGIVLRGRLQTNSFSGRGQAFIHTMELWMYDFENRRIPPIIIEQRFEADDEIVERRVVGVAKVDLSEALFKVPASFSTTRFR